jgi:hypothetical protein
MYADGLAYYYPGFGGEVDSELGEVGRESRCRMGE